MRTRKKSLFAASAALAALLAPAAARAQEGRLPSLRVPATQDAAAPAARKPSPERLASIAAERRNDPEAWHLLGVEYNLAGDVRAAREAFQKALSLRPRHVHARVGLAYTFYAEGKLDEAERHAHQAAVLDLRSKDFLAQNVFAAVHLQKFYQKCLTARADAEAALAAGETDPRWHLLKAQALIGLTIRPQRVEPDLSLASSPLSEAERAAVAANYRALTAEAATHLAEYLRLRPKADDRKWLQEQLEALRQQAGLDPAAEPVFSASEVTRKAIIRSKPEPSFTERARESNVQGIVRLRVVLGSDGVVRHILVTKPLSEGLAEKAVAAARAIRFTPAVKDGRPVSQHVTLEYNFNIY